MPHTYISMYDGAIILRREFFMEKLKKYIVNFNNILINKFLLIISIFLLCILVFINNSLGYSGTNGNLTYNLPDFNDIIDINLDEYFIMYYPGNNKYRLVFSKSTLNDELYPFYFYYNDINGAMQLRGNHSVNGAIYECSNNDTSWTLITNYNVGTSGIIYNFGYWDNDLPHFSEEEANKYIITSNCDVYFDDYTGKKLVFQKPPQVEIMALTQVEEIPEIMNKVLQLIIPVGLVILSIGLLIYVIKLVIWRVT